MAKFNLSAQEAIAEIKALRAEIENLKKSSSTLNQANSENFSKLENTITKLKAKVIELGQKMNYAEAIIKKMSASTQTNTSKTNTNTTSKKSNAKSSDDQAKSTDKASKATTKNTKEQEKNTKSSSSLANGFGSLKGAALGLLSAFGLIVGINLFGEIIKNVYENVKTFSALEFTLQKLTKTTLDYENSQKFILQLTRDYGVELVSTTGRWLKFSAAAEQSGLSLRETENIFRSMTKASAALGLKTHELEGVYLALEQMLSKGKVTTEELRRQLGERLPGAMGIMAASMGKTIPELDKMLRRGEVLSAEVLPNFARAVELAFGIDKVEKIDNLVAAQNRLVTAWQTMIQTLTESEGPLSRFFSFFVNGLTGVVAGAADLFSNDAQRIRVETSLFEEKLRLTGDFNSKNAAATEAGYKNLLEIEDKYNKAKLEINKAFTKEEKKASRDKVDVITSELTLIAKRSEEIQRAEALLTIENDKKLYEERLAEYNEYKKEFEKPVRNSFKAIFQDTQPVNGQSAYRDESKIAGINGDELKKSLVILGAIYNFKRKLIETSNVNIIEGDDGAGGTKKVMANLREIRDLKKDIEISVIEGSISNNEDLIKSDKINNSKRIKLIEENTKLQSRIYQLAYEIDEEALALHVKHELETLDSQLAKGTVTKKDYEEQKLKIQKEYDQKLTLAEQKRDEKIFDNKSSATNELLNIQKDANKLLLDEIQLPYNEEIIRLKEVYNQSKKTKEDRVLLQKGLAKVAIESANAQIDANINILKSQLALIEGLEGTEEAIQKIKNAIVELEASRKSADEVDEIDSSNWLDYFSDILGYASDYAKAIGDLFDAIGDARIENINAQIKAEEAKYDRLIELAEGDDAQQEVLRQAKEKRIEVLEKKRLKEEQKQAKARKAFAIADIAISTAQAIMRIWANSPDPTGISQGLLTAFVAGLGALQTAAVLASPIPQYKEGGKITKEHIGIINDGVAQEYIERGGKILTTENKDAIVQLKPRDIIHKDYKTLLNSPTIPKFMKEEGILEKDFNKLMTVIDAGIEKGFKKAKVSNFINIKEKNQDNYSDKLSKWNNG